MIYIFNDNVKKFKNIYPIHLNIDNIDLARGKHWILKSKDYYYLITANAGQSHDIHKNKERHFLFKKLTLDQLKTFDNGSYWKLIKEYNIGID